MFMFIPHTWHPQTTNESSTNDNKSYCKWKGSNSFSIDPDINKNPNDRVVCCRAKGANHLVTKRGDTQQNGQVKMAPRTIYKPNKMAWHEVRRVLHKRPKPAISSIKMCSHTPNEGCFVYAHLAHSRHIIHLKEVFSLVCDLQYSFVQPKLYVYILVHIECI